MSLKANPILTVFRNRAFTWLWAGQGISILGDQFEMIAAPWLVLKISNDPLALGTVMALSSIPRALFMLLGGAVSDRFSPRRIMLASDGLRLLLCAGLAGLIFSGRVELWMLYVFSGLFGLVSGFFSPAAGSMVPYLLERGQLQAGNSLMQGTAQLTNFIGPVLAGGLIAAFAASPSGQELEGIAWAFVLDGVSFLVSFLSLLKIGELETVEAERPNQTVLASIQSGLRFAMGNDALRVIFILIGAGNLFFVGPLLVGMPVLAQERLAGGAAALGLVMSAYGGGNLLGIVVAGSLPRPGARQMNVLIVVLISTFAAALGAFAFVRSTGLAFLVLLLVGTGNGYLTILAVTLLQQRTPPAMLGRIMSLVLLANIGLTPVSQTLAGFFIKISVEGLFLGAGSLMLGLALWVCFDPGARQLGENIMQTAKIE